MFVPKKIQQHFNYFILYKPYGIVCQFTGENGLSTLTKSGSLPKDVYPAGRLDTDSEGLVLLTNDGTLIHRLLDPRFRHPRTYLVQVERVPDLEALEKLQQGVVIEGKKTLPAKVTLLDAGPDLPPRPVPVRFRKNVPTAWLALTIHEGRNRQVRKMTAAVGHPTLRLVRIAIGSLKLEGLLPGEHRPLTRDEVRILRSSDQRG